MIRSLCAEHRALEAQAAQLLTIVSASVPDTAAVAVMRWRMAEALREHCRREDRLVHDRLLASDDAAAAALAGSFREAHGMLASAFDAFVAAWPVARVSREWEWFGAETRILLADLAERIAQEEQVLFVHLERVVAQEQAAA